MRIGDLVAELSKLDPNMEVICSTDDPVIVGGREWYAFDPQDVSVVDAIAQRDDEGVVHFRYEKGELSRRIAVINLAPDL